MPLHSDLSNEFDDRQATSIKKHLIVASTNSKTLLAATKRKGFHVFNYSDSDLFVDYGSAVSIDDFAVCIPPHGYWEPPYITALELRGIWASNNGKALIREFI